jgi:hypothetical protein
VTPAIHSEIALSTNIGCVCAALFIAQHRCSFCWLPTPFRRHPLPSSSFPSSDPPARPTCERRALASALGPPDHTCMHHLTATATAASVKSAMLTILCPFFCTRPPACAILPFSRCFFCGGGQRRYVQHLHLLLPFMSRCPSLSAAHPPPPLPHITLRRRRHRTHRFFHLVHSHLLMHRSPCMPCPTRFSPSSSTHV